jgi:hypothetical protein
MRRHLAIEPGGPVMMEMCGGELLLKPAAVPDLALTL